MNNLGCKHSLITKFGQLYNIAKDKLLPKRSTKNLIWKLVPGPFLSIMNPQLKRNWEGLHADFDIF